MWQVTIVVLLVGFVCETPLFSPFSNVIVCFKIKKEKQTGNEKGIVLTSTSACYLKSKGYCRCLNLNVFKSIEEAAGN